ncbi:XRE family transcriptional regulator [Confluentibacter sediminis]|uniref:XRE family transcriptional regulator n=1 Tax=Confluentibacter sediminis TaxID=2219045 RepID=UPI000DAF21AC|nr:XRE family transcriptional regulator [Confluentibacter sediminis]
MSGLSDNNIILANKIADRIKALRIQYTGKEQINFVKKYNIEKQDISRWENHVKRDKKTGKIKGRGITIYTIQNFCNLIGITLDTFFNDESFRK